MTNVTSYRAVLMLPCIGESPQDALQHAQALLERFPPTKWVWMLEVIDEEAEHAYVYLDGYGNTLAERTVTELAQEYLDAIAEEEGEEE